MALTRRCCQRDAYGRDKPGVAIAHLRASSIYGPGMVCTTVLPALVARALRNAAFAAARAGPYFQNFVHVADILQPVVALLPEDRVPVVVNAFSDDTYEFDAPAGLTRPKLGSSSQIVDESYAAEGREPVFLNRIAKRLHPAQHEEAG
jgi:nucleoside-diphosphate-sugar epimerase